MKLYGMYASGDAAGSGTHHPEWMSLELACTAPQILCTGLMRVRHPVHMLQLNAFTCLVCPGLRLDEFCFIVSIVMNEIVRQLIPRTTCTWLWQ